jgi:hypothetical protein
MRELSLLRQKANIWAEDCLVMHEASQLVHLKSIPSVLHAVKLVEIVDIDLHSEFQSLK